MLTLDLNVKNWGFKTPFSITGKTWTGMDIITVTLNDGKCQGRGEGIGIFYTGETADTICEQINSVKDAVENGLSRIELLEALPHGGARNVIDCALWDLEAKQQQKTIWELTNISPKTLTTVMTIGIEDTAEAMAKKALEASQYPLLKIKLDGHEPLERMIAIRAARPDARLVIDANQGWDFDLLKDIAPKLATMGVEMVEQPLPRGADSELASYNAPLPICADESCLHLGELEQNLELYDMINIKLDKTGGLTHALQLAEKAKAAGKTLMVGSMCGTSISMAPSFVVGTLCTLVDIDGPLLLKEDHPNGLIYNGSEVDPFTSKFWG